MQGRGDEGTRERYGTGAGPMWLQLHGWRMPQRHGRMVHLQHPRLGGAATVPTQKSLLYTSHHAVCPPHT